MSIIVKSTKRVPIGELSPYPGNARNGDVDAIEESVRATGIFRAMVVNQPTMEVLAGNHLLHALHQAGETHALVHFVDVDERVALQINLADNRTAELGGYDTAQLVESLQALEGDFTGTGYDEDSLGALLSQLDQEAGGQIEEPTRTCPSCGHTAPASKFKTE